MELVRSSIHLWVTKKVAAKPSAFNRGATKVRWDFTASSKVSTTSLSGIRTAVAPKAVGGEDAQIATTAVITMDFTVTINWVPSQNPGVALTSQESLIASA